jgi:hypothetical protein
VNASGNLVGWWCLKSESGIEVEQKEVAHMTMTVKNVSLWIVTSLILQSTPVPAQNDDELATAFEQLLVVALSPGELAVQAVIFQEQILKETTQIDMTAEGWAEMSKVFTQEDLPRNIAAAMAERYRGKMTKDDIAAMMTVATTPGGQKLVAVAIAASRLSHSQGYLLSVQVRSWYKENAERYKKNTVEPKVEVITKPVRRAPEPIAEVMEKIIIPQLEFEGTTPGATAEVLRQQAQFLNPSNKPIDIVFIEQPSSEPQRISINRSNVSLRDAIMELAAATASEFVIVDNTVFIGKDVKAIAGRATSPGAPLDIEVLAVLSNLYIPRVWLQSASLPTVFAFFDKQHPPEAHGFSFVAHLDDPAAIGRESEPTVSLDLNNTSVFNVIRAICIAKNLTWRLEDRTVIIEYPEASNEEE